LAGFVIGHGAFDENFERAVALEQLNLAGASPPVRPQAAAEFPKGCTRVRDDILFEGLSSGVPAVKAQQGSPEEVDLTDYTDRIDYEATDWGEVEKFGVVVRRLLNLGLDAVQFFILHLQFDLVDLKFMNQRVDLRLAQRLLRRPLFGA
jgi:hypothetical protein